MQKLTDQNCAVGNGYEADGKRKEGVLAFAVYFLFIRNILKKNNNMLSKRTDLLAACMRNWTCYPKFNTEVKEMNRKSIMWYIDYGRIFYRFSFHQFTFTFSTQFLV